MNKDELFFPLASLAENVAHSGSYVNIVKRLTTTVQVHFNVTIQEIQVRVYWAGDDLIFYFL